MCGIVGYIEKEEHFSSDHIEQMKKLIRHRGPDDDGTTISDLTEGRKIAQGFVRLSILDTSLNGHQPMSDADERVTITYNGEVFNAFTYKDELISDGVKFKGTSDTEVIMQLYLKYGIDGMIKRMNGMFAFCLVDHRDGTVYLVRDRLGIKPLFYYAKDDLLIYGSEIKSFYAHPRFENKLRKEMLPEYLMFRYVAGKDTLLEDVYEVEPGHYLKYKDGFIEDHAWWTLPDKAGSKDVPDYANLVEESVKDRLLSDVKIGVELSGGIDSSLATWYASKHVENELESYSIVFDDEVFSEKKWMDAVADKTGVIQHQITMNKDHVLNNLDKATWFMDSPIAFPNSVGLHIVCKEAYANGVRVLLTGEGADEVFGGYLSDADALWAAAHPLLRAAYDLMRRLTGRRVKYSIDRKKSLVMSDSLFSEGELKRLLKTGTPDAGVKKRKALFDSTPGTGYGAVKYLNYKIRTYFAELCMRQDKMSMSASIESRVPFCNYEILETVRRQPSNTYIRPCLSSSSEDTKLPLKAISKEVYGEEFTYRPKSGFPLPLADYFKEKDFAARVESEILPTVFDTGLFNNEEVKRLWVDRDSLKGGAIEQLWLIIAFGVWARIFLADKDEFVRKWA